MSDVSFDVLKGKTIVSISGAEVGSDRIEFTCKDGSKFVLYHSQDCCENVIVEEIHGDIDDLLKSKLLLAEEVSNDPAGERSFDPDGYVPESYTWTFYRLRTRKGTVTLRWLGTSNGYYSERVNFERIDR